MPKKHRAGFRRTADALAVVAESHDSVLPAIPSAQDMQKYNEIVPDFAERVLTMAETQQVAQIEASRIIDDRQYDLAKRIQYIILIISVLSIFLCFAGFYLGFGSPAVGSVSMGLSIAFMVYKGTQRK